MFLLKCPPFYDDNLRELTWNINNLCSRSCVNMLNVGYFMSLQTMQSGVCQSAAGGLLRPKGLAVTSKRRFTTHERLPIF